MDFTDLDNIPDKHYIERMHVVAITYPYFSRKYQRFITCLAGLTKKEEWRRIYPISAKWLIESGIKKGDEVEYRIKNEHPEHRYESRRIYPETLRYTRDHKDIIKIEFKTNSLTYATEKGMSLAVIEPTILGFRLNKREISQNPRSKRDFISLKLPLYYPQYRFVDKNDMTKIHKSSCEDMEYVAKCDKLQKQGFDAIYHELFLPFKDSDVLFVMGTHYLFNTWIIISIINC
jgi:hypothetical protein